MAFGVAALATAQDEPAAGRADAIPRRVYSTFQESCFACHGEEKLGGLDLRTDESLRHGGDNGRVVVPHDPEASSLYQYVSHRARPFMPYGGDKLPETQVDLIRQWIEQGALENAGSKKAASQRPDWSFQPTAADDGPGAMPERWLRQPVTITSRRGQIASLACSPRAPLVAVSGYRQASSVNTSERSGPRAS